MRGSYRSKYKDNGRKGGERQKNALIEIQEKF